jgi:hypothetical protein
MLGFGVLSRSEGWELLTVPAGVLHTGQVVGTDLLRLAFHLVTFDGFLGGRASPGPSA